MNKKLIAGIVIAAAVVCCGGGVDILSENVGAAIEVYSVVCAVHGDWAVYVNYACGARKERKCAASAEVDGFFKGSAACVSIFKPGVLNINRCSVKESFACALGKGQKPLIYE